MVSLLSRFRRPHAPMALADRAVVPEALAAGGLDDRDLARLNDRNTRVYEGAPWAAARLIQRGGQRP